MKTFFVGLALGFGIGFLLLPRSNNEREDLIRERTRELQRTLPAQRERELQSAAIQERDRFSRPRRPEYIGSGGAVRAGIHPVSFLNMATEKDLQSAGMDAELAARIIAHRPYSSLQDAMERGPLSASAISEVQKAAAAREPLPLQPLA
jgi:hypothetical protein